MEKNVTVAGTILVAGDIKRLMSGTYLRISLLDVTQADAAARSVAETIMQPDWKSASEQDGIPFQLVADELTEGRSYALSAIISKQADNHIEPGDYITMESYPVIPGKQVSYQLIVKPV